MSHSSGPLSAATVHDGHDAPLWGGAALPYAVPSKKLGMWLFIVSDAITFSAVIFAYGYLRLASADWPRPFGTPSIVNATVMTFVLLSSSLAMVLGVRASALGKVSGAVGWLLATALGGVIFYDGGNVYSAINFQNFANNYTNTVGIGLRYATPIGPIRIDVGRNLNPVSGIGATQYYITLGQAF